MEKYANTYYQLCKHPSDQVSHCFLNLLGGGRRNKEESLMSKDAGVEKTSGSHETIYRCNVVPNNMHCLCKGSIFQDLITDLPPSVGGHDLNMLQTALI